MKSKGNVFKNKRVMMEYIHKVKAEKARSQAIAYVVSFIRVSFNRACVVTRLKLTAQRPRLPVNVALNVSLPRRNRLWVTLLLSLRPSLPPSKHSVVMAYSRHQRIKKHLTPYMYIGEC
jgi:hypothetical protein